MAPNEGERWLVGTSIPVILFALGIAITLGAIYNSTGRIAILEADLTSRNALLPAHATAERLKLLEDTTRALPAFDARIGQQVDALRADVARLNGITERAVIERNDSNSRLAAVETALKDMQDRARRLREDLNMHRESDEAMLRARLLERERSGK